MRSTIVFLPLALAAVRYTVAISGVNKLRIRDDKPATTITILVKKQPSKDYGSYSSDSTESFGRSVDIVYDQSTGLIDYMKVDTRDHGLATLILTLGNDWGADPLVGKEIGHLAYDGDKTAPCIALDIEPDVHFDSVVYHGVTYHPDNHDPNGPYRDPENSWAARYRCEIPA